MGPGAVEPVPVQVGSRGPRKRPSVVGWEMQKKISEEQTDIVLNNKRRAIYFILHFELYPLMSIFQMFTVSLL